MSKDSNGYEIVIEKIDRLVKKTTEFYDTIQILATGRGCDENGPNTSSYYNGRGNFFLRAGAIRRIMENQMPIRPISAFESQFADDIREIADISETALFIFCENSDVDDPNESKLGVYANGHILAIRESCFDYFVKLNEKEDY